MIQETDLKTLKQIAARHGLSHVSVYNAVRCGRLQAVRIRTGKHNMYLVTEEASDKLWGTPQLV